jgi:hypothetical protein
MDEIRDTFIGYPVAVARVADSRKEMSYFLSTLVTLDRINVTCDDSGLDGHIPLQR